MPYKAKKPCIFRGCPNLTESGSSYCREHKLIEDKRYNKSERNPESNKRYGRDWKKIRTAFLSVNPLCEICKDSGKLKAANLVHHKIKLSDGGTNDKNNLMSLCQDCHSRIHVEQGDRW